MKHLTTLTLLTCTLCIASGANSQSNTAKTRVVVTVENLAPNMGTFQTPFWVAFHDGNFDIYDRDQPASLLFPSFPEALERLAEDGTTSVIAQAFLAQGFGSVEATLAGPEGPIAPGDIVTQSFLLDPNAASSRYFSYASMVIPSNDAFVANGNPLAHPLFDAQGQFVAEPFFITGEQVLDAGTEINDELPANTAFFGQAAPNTGVDENGNIILHAGFNPVGSGGILDAARFAAADFTQAGYPVVRISFSSAPAIVDDRVYKSLLGGEQEVPPVQGRAFGYSVYKLINKGSEMKYAIKTVGIETVTALHLHLGAAGEVGPVVAVLEPVPELSQRYFNKFSGTLTASDLTGSLQGAPLDALVAEIEAGNVYVNVHSKAYPDGEIRGQLGSDF